MIHQHLDELLKNEIQKAREVFFAVGLFSTDGVKMLLKDLSANKKIKPQNVHIIIGVSMPTPKEALELLMNAGNFRGFDIRCFKENAGFFHPKVYLFKHSNNFKAYVGSANYTTAGLGKNIEMSVEITDSDDFDSLLKWFKAISKTTKKITPEMLEKYSVDKGIKRFKGSKSYNVSVMSKLMKNLSELQKKDIYKDFCKNRKKEWEHLHSLVGDRDHNFDNFKVEEFCKDNTLGAIDNRNISSIKSAKKNKSLQYLCKLLSMDDVSPQQKFQLALSSERYKVHGAGEAFVTKYLCTLYPKECWVWNDISGKQAANLDISFPRGTPKSVKYITYCDLFENIIKKLNIDDFTILDRMLLYLETGE